MGRELADSIAIVGMACIVPGADTPGRFWQNIVQKRDCITDAPPDWQPELFYDAEGKQPDRTYSNKGGFLGDLCRFNPTKYGVVPNSVDGAEPDHFIALRCAFEALQDAGVPQVALNRERTGVIIGRGLFVNRGWVSVFQRTFVVDQVLSVLQRLEPDRSPAELELLRIELKKSLPPSNAETVPGLVHSALVGRVANRLDLKGPAYTVDAACSSALVAVQHGIRELQSGSCDAVLVGGSQVSTPAPVHILFCYLSALSRAGRIAPFAADAAGTLLGQGCGMLVLKRKSDAERDGNRIYALIRAVGLSSDGKGAGLLAPLSEGQQRSIQRAYESAEISPSTIGLIEAHGTGIPLGDATEIATIRSCFEGTGAGEPVALGSVKSMIGHLIPASGAASLIKTALALYHRVLPPTLHAETPNPALKLEKSRFFLVNEARPWIHGDRATPRRAGVNAFGFGGINAHAIVEEYVGGDESALKRLDREWPSELVVVAAADRAALRARLASHADWIERSPCVPLLDIAGSCARERGASRIAIVAKDREDLVRKLRHAEKLLADPARDKIQDRRHGIFWFERPLALEGRIAFVFPGEGAQYPNMMEGLCRQFPEVRRHFDLTAEALRLHGLRTPFGQILFPQPAQLQAAEEALFGLEVAVAAVTAAGRGLLELMARLKVVPAAILGHSSGEFGALLAAGAYKAANEEQSIHAIRCGAESARQLEHSKLVPKASLLSVGGADPAALEAVLRDADGRLVVAMDNCPGQVVIVGDEAEILRAIRALRGKGGLCERLPWERAYHTEAFKPACEIIEAFYAPLNLGTPDVELWSCATAAPFPRDTEGVRELAVRQWRSKVRFRETIEAMHASGVRVFVELGPRGNLSAFIGDTLGDKPHAAVPLDVHRKDSLQQLCTAVGMLVAHGVDVDLAPLFDRRAPQQADLQGAPRAAPSRDPILPLEFPELSLEPAFVEGFRRRPPSAPQVSAPAAAPQRAAGAPPLAASTPPLAASTPPLAASTPSEPARRAAAPERTAAPAPAPALPAPAYAPVGGPAAENALRLAALQDFQRTMQVFLDAQRNLMAPAAARGLPARSAGAPTIIEAAPLASATPPALKGGAPVAHEAAPAAPVANGAAPVAHGAVPVANGAAPVANRSAPPVLSRGLEPSPRSAVLSPAPEVKRQHFIQRILEHQPDQRLVAECDLDLNEDVFLQDHTFFGRGLSKHDPDLKALSIMPLAMTLELMAEAAATLRPHLQVTALSEITTSKWLTFDVGTRRVRMVVEAEGDALVRAKLYEADREGMSGEVASAVVEMSAAPLDLGPPQLPEVDAPPPPWKPEETYKILYHGPAFRGIEAVERRGPSGLQARVRVADERGLFRSTSAPGLVLPVVLIDTASQLPGVANGSLAPEGPTVTLAFPNSTGRMEFAAGPALRGPLVAVVRYSQDETYLRSDVEMKTADGRVVLRYMERVEEIVRFPAGPYLYWVDPRRVTCSRDITALFAGVPGIEQCTVTEVERAGDKLLVNRHWSKVLARMILSRSERADFERAILPPVPAAGWLLGRVAAKDAVRLQGRLDVCMADVVLRSDAHGKPLASVQGEAAPGISLSHKGFHAVAAATQRAAGIGIDVEPLRPLDPGVVEDAFYPAERALLEALSAPHAYAAAWTAKEAIGKALGRGVLGGPRSIRLIACERAGAGFAFAAVLEGAMAQAFPEHAQGGKGGPLAAHARISAQHMVALCIPG